jgi:hypothetical protein
VVWFLFKILGCVDMMEEIKGFVAISYPWYIFNLYFRGFFSSFIFSSHYDFLKSKKSKFFIIGDSDEFTGLSTFEGYYKELPDSKQKFIVEGEGHFWTSSKSVLINKINEYLGDQIKLFI